MAKYTDFVTWLKGELDLRGWTMKDLAEKADLTASTISRLLSGERQPGPESLGAIAKAFDLSPEFVFRKAGVLPRAISRYKETDAFEQEWMQLLSMATTDEERKELIERARFEMQRIREKRAPHRT